MKDIYVYSEANMSTSLVEQYKNNQRKILEKKSINVQKVVEDWFDELILTFLGNGGDNQGLDINFVHQWINRYQNDKSVELIYYHLNDRAGYVLGGGERPIPDDIDYDVMFKQICKRPLYRTINKPDHPLHECNIILRAHKDPNIRIDQWVERFSSITGFSVVLDYSGETINRNSNIYTWLMSFFV